jgi:alpha-D-ribose 1-methylphosphonate 5-triphosphate synthase subunit PhnH
MSAPLLAAGLLDPVHDAQRIFRTVMDAMARPGTINRLAVSLGRPAALAPGAAAIALALCDFETPVWLDPALAADDAVKTFLRFHTGAPIVARRSAATFALLSSGREPIVFEEFALGTAEYPDRSTTLVIAVDDLAEDEGWTLTGPGIADERRLRVGPLPADLPARLAANRALFPRGIDLVFVAGDRVSALPRTTVVQA